MLSLWRAGVGHGQNRNPLATKKQPKSSKSGRRSVGPLHIDMHTLHRYIIWYTSFAVIVSPQQSLKSIPSSPTTTRRRSPRKSSVVLPSSPAAKYQEGKHQSCHTFCLEILIKMAKLLFTILAVLSALTPAHGGAVELTLDNYAEKTRGKNSFIKFLAPWYVDGRLSMISRR